MAFLCVAAIPIAVLLYKDDYYLRKRGVAEDLARNTVGTHFDGKNMQHGIIFEMNRHGARAPYLR